MKRFSKLYVIFFFLTCMATTHCMENSGATNKKEISSFEKSLDDFMIKGKNRFIATAILDNQLTLIPLLQAEDDQRPSLANRFVNDYIQTKHLNHLTKDKTKKITAFVMLKHAPSIVTLILKDLKKRKIS